jgi:hypothetical protein
MDFADSLAELEAIERRTNAEHRLVLTSREAERMIHMRLAIRVGHLYDEGITILYGGTALWHPATAQ